MADEHFHRYSIACGSAKGKRVLHLAPPEKALHSPVRARPDSDYLSQTQLGLEPTDL